MIVTTGVAFALTVNTIAAEPGVPWAFVAVAVMVCTPWERVVTANAAPLPITPSRSESQTRLAVTSPSSGSVDDPAKATRSPSVTPEPVRGAVIVTLGVTGMYST